MNNSEFRIQNSELKVFRWCVYIGRMEHLKTRKKRAGTRGARVQRLYNPCKNTKGALSFKLPKRGGRKK